MGKKGLILASSISAAFIIVFGLCAGAESGESTGMLWGGCGGVYFYASTGELWVEVEKQDLNTGRQKTHLRALLFSPDRRVLDEAWIPDDGRAAGSGPGPVHRVRLRTDVERPGVYGLNITVANDRYGENMSWGFRTNCQRYLVETSRGHRDARHEEPLVFRSPGREGDVCFLPQSAPFSIEVSGLAQGIGALPVYDSTDRVITTLTVSPGDSARYSFPAGTPRANTPWRLHLPKSQAVVTIDGVTSWSSGYSAYEGKAWENLSLWTPAMESWFPFHDNRWLLTPYRRIIYAAPGTEGSAEFTIHNNSSGQKHVRLTLEFDRGEKWPATLPTPEETLGAYSSAPVSLSFTVPEDGDEWTCYVRATVQDETRFSTWSSVTLRRGVAPSDAPIPMPIKLEPYSHENEQFGYLPDYPLDNQVYFDLKNRPFIIAGDGIYTLRDTTWVKTATARHAVSGKIIPIRPAGTKVAFDRDNDVYCLGRADGTTVLLHSRDHGATFTAWPVPGLGSFDIEQFSGHNLPDGPPPLARFRETAKDPTLFWRSLNDLDLFLPVKKTDGTIEIGNPILVSKLSIGLSVHSGIPSTIVSRENNVHITWGEATDPEADVPGVPTFVATYDRITGTLGKPALVGYGPPANDIHNTPCITMDSKGYLHVLVGTHGRTFKYARSLAPNNADGGWTDPEDVGPGLLQTYVGMVCDKNDTLHLVFRLWRNDIGPYPSDYHATLAYMSKRPGGTWSGAQPLIIAPFSDYSIFYHRLTIDRNGSLFLSYDYWSTYWFYRTDHRGNRRALLMSPDGGVTWKLAPARAIVQR